MTYALRVRLDGWTINELEATSAWRYDLVENAQRAWKQAQDENPLKAHPPGSHGYNRALEPGVGPQFVDPRDE